MMWKVKTQGIVISVIPNFFLLTQDRNNIIEKQYFKNKASPFNSISSSIKKKKNTPKRNQSLSNAVNPFEVA